LVHWYSFLTEKGIFQFFLQRNQTFLKVQQIKANKSAKSRKNHFRSRKTVFFKLYLVAEYHLQQTNFGCHIWTNSSPAYEFQNGFFLCVHSFNSWVRIVLNFFYNAKTWFKYKFWCDFWFSKQIFSNKHFNIGLTSTKERFRTQELHFLTECFRIKTAQT
jgi:hypothetical protein